MDSSQSRVAPLWGLVPRTLSWSFTSLKGSWGCLSPKLVCARTWVSTRLHCTRPHTHTHWPLFPAEKPGSGRCPAVVRAGSVWTELASLSPHSHLPSGAAGQSVELRTSEPSPPSSPRNGSLGLVLALTAGGSGGGGQGGVTAGAMPTHSPFSSPPPPLCGDCCWISQSHFLNPSLSQVQGRDLGAQGGKKCSPGSLQG